MWILASAKSTSRPFIQIFLTSSNGIEGLLVLGAVVWHRRAEAEDASSIGAAE
jgi:hypothetical protein